MGTLDGVVKVLWGHTVESGLNGKKAASSPQTQKTFNQESLSFLKYTHHQIL